MMGVLVFQMFIEFGTCIFTPSVHNQGFNVYSPLGGQHSFINEYTCSDIPQLHEEITEKYSELLGPLPLKLPPFHEVSHEVPLIDESK